MLWNLLSIDLLILSFKAFSNDVKKNTGLTFLLVQIKSLLVKRFRIFYRRYILAGIILLLPFLLEIILTGVIPSSSNLVNTQTGKVQVLGQYQLGLNSYQTPQILSYYFNDSGVGNTAYLQSLLSALYSPSSSSQVSLNPMLNDSVNSYVLDLRKASLDNMLYKYYAGMWFLNTCIRLAHYTFT